MRRNPVPVFSPSNRTSDPKSASATGLQFSQGGTERFAGEPTDTPFHFVNRTTPKHIRACKSVLLHFSFTGTSPARRLPAGCRSGPPRSEPRLPHGRSSPYTKRVSGCAGDAFCLMPLFTTSAQLRRITFPRPALWAVPRRRQVPDPPDHSSGRGPPPKNSAHR